MLTAAAWEPRLADRADIDIGQLIAIGATESDPARLKEAYSQLNDLVLDEAFVHFISVSPPSLLARSNVHGITWTAHESPWYVDTWLA